MVDFQNCLHSSLFLFSAKKINVFHLGNLLLKFSSCFAIMVDFYNCLYSRLFLFSAKKVNVFHLGNLLLEFHPAFQSWLIMVFQQRSSFISSTLAQPFRNFYDFLSCSFMKSSSCISSCFSIMVNFQIYLDSIQIWLIILVFQRTERDCLTD